MGAGTIAVPVLAVAVVVSWPGIREEWYLHRLRTGDDEALGRLEMIGGDRATFKPPAASREPPADRGHPRNTRISHIE